MTPGQRPHFADVTVKLTFHLEDKPKGHDLIFSGEHTSVPRHYLKICPRDLEPLISSLCYSRCGNVEEFPEGVPGITWDDQKAGHLCRLVTALQRRRPAAVILWELSSRR